MATKYIQKNKLGKWTVKNTKAERASRIFNSQAEAMDYAASLKSTKLIMVKGTNGKFRKLTGWDQWNTKNDLTKVGKQDNFKSTTKNKSKKNIIIFILVIVLFVSLGIALGIILA